MLDDQTLQLLIWNSFDPNWEYRSFSEGKERTEDIWREQGKAIRKELWKKVKESKPYLKSKESWSMADSCIREVTISPTGEEISIWIDGVVDYDTEPYEDWDIQPLPVTTVNVHLRLTGVQDYRILQIHDGRMVEEDTKEKHLHKQLRAGEEFSQWKISDDFYEIYEDGRYSFLILSAGVNGSCIQVDCLEMEAESELGEGQEEYLREFLEGSKEKH